MNVFISKFLEGYVEAKHAQDERKKRRRLTSVQWVMNESGEKEPISVPMNPDKQVVLDGKRKKEKKEKKKEEKKKSGKKLYIQKKMLVKYLFCNLWYFLFVSHLFKHVSSTNLLLFYFFFSSFSFKVWNLFFLLCI